MHPYRMLAAAGLMMVSALAWGNVQYTFYANGVTENYAQQGMAIFDFSNDGSTLSITLSDTVDPTSAIQSEVTGLDFALSFAPATMSLTSIGVAQVIDCTNSANPCPTGSGTSPYGWGATLDGGTLSLGAGFDGNSFTYQPFGIVNANYISLASGGGLGAASTNPLLVGPVTFHFALSGLSFAPEVGSVVFAFGDPDRLAATTVPEPASLSLIGLGLAAAGWTARRRSGNRTAA